MRPIALIIDDEPLMRHWLTRLLQRVGIDSCEAENNTQALTFVQAHPPELIITDMYRPGGTGLAFIRQVRALPTLQAMPIVLISGGATLVDRQQAEQAGAIATLSKPFEPEELYAVIERIRLPEWEST